jgi:hypothetical protein
MLNYFLVCLIVYNKYSVTDDGYSYTILSGYLVSRRVKKRQESLNLLHIACYSILYMLTYLIKLNQK